MSQESGTKTETKTRSLRPTRVGVVARARSDKTLRVEVSYLVKHPKYGKYMRKRTVCHAHDEKGEAREGDHVEIMECRPISKTKRWRLVKVLSRTATA